MNILLIGTVKVFQTFCIGLVLYLTYQQFREYTRNQDSSSVSYRTFNDKEKDVYPTFSICLHSTDGSILKHDSNFFGIKEKEQGVTNYHRMLLGYDNVTEDFMQIDFDNSVVNILEKFIDISLSHTRQGQYFDEWYRPTNSNIKSPFYKSYQEPYFSCITKSSKFVKKQLLDYDYVVLNSSNIHQYLNKAYNFGKQMSVLVYIHHPGQLIREFGKQILDLKLDDFQKAMNGTLNGLIKNNYRDIHLSQVEVLRKRSDGLSSCNESLESEDHLWLEKVVNNVKCLPTYWKGLLQPSSLQHFNVSTCNSSKNYDYIHSNFLPPNYFENGSTLYHGLGPCNQMRVVLSVLTKEDVSESLILGFRYSREEYRETNNIEKFGM